VERLHHRLQALTSEQRAEVLGSLDERSLRALAFDWVGMWARDAQLIPPGDWFTWLVLAGRGFGKSRCGAEAVRHLVETGQARRVALIAATSADARDVMVEGDSGILSCSPPWFRPKFEPSKRRLTWPNGALATMYSAEEGSRLRGPQHDLCWADELAAWTDTDGEDTWDNMVMGLRLGGHPRVIVTTTPKPTKLVQRLVKDTSGTVITSGSTWDNAANLPAKYKDYIRRTYAGTRLGRQEIYAEVLTDIGGALFNLEHVDAHRVPVAPNMDRIVIAIDPSPTSLHGSDETGIMAVGKGPPPQGKEADGGHCYVLQDHTMKGSPDEWARAAIKAFHLHKADRIIAETNNGGEMVEAVIRSVDPDVPFTAVRAMRGKSKRAEPVAALMEQGRIHLVGTDFEKLERQLKVFTGINGKRDDRVDSMNWAIHELMLSGGFAFV
jgi:predicted phage terminase large subunit-like protein